MNAIIKPQTTMSVRTKVIRDIVYCRDGKQHIITEANAKKILSLRKVIVKCSFDKIPPLAPCTDNEGFITGGAVAFSNISITIKYKKTNVVKRKYTVHIGEKIEFELSEAAFKNLYNYIRDVYKGEL